MLMTKFEIPPDSPTIIIIDPDDQPMWLSTRTVAPTPSFAIVQLPISNNSHIKGTHMHMIQDNQFDGESDDPTQGILDAEDKILLKLNFSSKSQINPKPKTIVSTSGSNINPDHAILMEKLEALTTKVDSEFLIIRCETV
ncbi:hypothetical protein Tco_1192299, partial [Tanacetum coccineum]